MKMEEGFKVRDLSRSVLALENDLNTLKTQNSAIHKLHLQWEASLKEQINHYEKFREKYAARQLKNKGKLSGALPDQESEYQTLVDFDKERKGHFKTAEDKENQKLNNNKIDDKKREIRSKEAERRKEQMITMKKTKN